MSVLGLHHVTATVDDAQADLDFAGTALGMRLVKKTVNFDNTGVYHFYYGDELGRPSTLWTTFPYRGRGVRVGAHGAGQIAVTSLSVPRASLAFWRARLEGAGLSARDVASPFDEGALHVTDPSGLVIGLVATDDDARTPWTGGPVATAHATRGLHSVTLLVRTAQPTIRFLADLLGFSPVAESEGRTRVAVNGGGPGRFLDIVAAPSAPGAVNGLGTVHHVALAVATADDQARIRADVVRLGVPVTPVMDRQYFQSIYFREPGGVLLEIATSGPGFATDESPEHLGSALKLPPWEESNRAAIEAALPQVRH